MAVTDYKFPGTCASVDNSSGKSWITPDNAKTQNDTGTYCDADNDSKPEDWLRLTNFGFDATDIPVGATINGIEFVTRIRQESFYKSGDITDHTVKVRDSTGQIGDNEASVSSWGIDVGYANRTYGGATDMLGTTLDQADIVASTFGIDISIQCDDSIADQKGYVDCVKIRVYYTVAVDDPTVTTSACDDVEKTTATANGNISATGGENCTRRGFCYKVGTSGDPDTGDDTEYADGDFGTGVFDEALTGLVAATSYRVRAYAVNTSGTGYGDTVQLKTKSDFIAKVYWC